MQNRVAHTQVAVKLAPNGFGTGAVFTLRFQKPFNKDNDFILKLVLKASVLSSAVGGQFVRAMPVKAQRKNCRHDPC